MDLRNALLNLTPDYSILEYVEPILNTEYHSQLSVLCIHIHKPLSARRSVSFLPIHATVTCTSDYANSSVVCLSLGVKCH